MYSFNSINFYYYLISKCLCWIFSLALAEELFPLPILVPLKQHLLQLSAAQISMIS